MKTSLLILLLALGASGVVVGCVPARGGWKLDALPTPQPGLAEMDTGRLEDLLPHFLPEQGGLLLYLCRWTGSEPIPVSLPDDATPDEQALLERALDAWAGAGLGVRFEPAAPGAAKLEIRFADGLDGLPAKPAGWMPGGTGDTLVDCRVKSDFGGTSGRTQLDAEIVFASIYLRRYNQGLVGQVVRLSADELMGSTLHELGHALGFGSHVAVGRSIMRVETDVVRRIGKRVNAGEAFTDATLSALYRLPSGVVVGRRALAEESWGELSRLVELVDAAGMAGPFSRSGDRNARLFWRRPAGGAIAMRAHNWNLQMRGRIPLRIEPNAPALMLLRGIEMQQEEAP
jgi:hypothetical protein